MDIGQFLSYRLLQDSEGDSNSLQVFGTSGHVDVDGTKPCIVDDGGLSEEG